MMQSYVLFRRISLGLVVLGILVAGYLSWAYLSNTDVLCSGVGGCDMVRQSAYSRVLGVPVAVIGLAGYFAILAVFVLEEIDSSLADSAPILVFGLSLVGTLYSAYLTYLEIFVIFAVCPYCVVSAIVMTLIFAIALHRLLGDLPGEYELAQDERIGISNP
jgi:uncharacterized membrane protein